MDVLIPHLVTNAALASPDNTAVSCGEDTLSYAGLDTWMHRMSIALHELGVRRGDRVGIFMDKSVRGCIAMYGIMRCGAVYVPLDPSAPAPRLIRMIEDADIAWIVSGPEKKRMLASVARQTSILRFVIGLAELEGLECVDWQEIERIAPQQNSNGEVNGDDPAYIIYTSGSTGVPKGIVHTHSSGLSFARWAAGEYGLQRSDRLSNHAPLHFDLSIFDYFAGAMVGAATIVVPEEYTRLPASYSQFLQDQRVSVFFTVPFALIQLLMRGVLEQRDLSSLRWVIYGGEPFPAKHLRQLMDVLPQVRFDNMYGPAEVNGCTHYTLPQDFDPSTPVPIGPIAKIAESLVVDESNANVRVGEIGELLVRTPTMMRGYWGRPELNEKAFHYRHSASGPDHIFYRTGDLVRCDETGVMEFIGRKDRQVKVRGYRIELDEVESALETVEQVVESAAFTTPDSEGSKQIRAVVLTNAESSISAPDVLRELRKRLPWYAVPADIECRNELPRTSTGKIDRNHLMREFSAAEDRQ